MRGTTPGANTEVRPFRIDVPQDEIDELYRRIDATRWPTAELVDDRSQGVQSATWEEGAEIARFAGQAPPPVSVPVGFTTFPGEIWRTPRSWVERVYPTTIYFNEVDKGGHFAAWEEPELFTEEIRATFRTVRSATS